jgi:phosphogluconate dehydratase
MTTPSPIPATLHRVVDEVTRRIVERSRADRQTYLDTMGSLRRDSSYRRTSASSPPTTTCCRRTSPMSTSPRIRAAARALGATAQVAGGVPAMCDGVTQGSPGMELSLFSRDVIALATAVALSHDVFDAALMPRRVRQDRARGC